MKVDTYACDSCGAQKKETNHWFRFATLKADGVNGMAVWDWETNPSEGETHLCSDACVVKQVQAWLSQQQAAGKAAE